MGRKTKLTDKLEADLVEHVAAGNFVTVACKALNVSQSTFYRWMNSDAPRYRQFQDKITSASARAEADAVTCIRRHSRDDWRAAAWYLERRHFTTYGPPRRDPDSWGQVPAKVSLPTAQGEQGTAQPVYELDLESLPPEALSAIVKQIEERSGVDIIDGVSTDTEPSQGDPATGEG
jgi:hypothetical protein